jgi:archaellum component FlaC
MQNRVKEIENNLEKLSLPKANANERLGDIKTKARQTATDLDKARELVIDLSNQFDRVKRDRYKRFTECLDTISSSIDHIYKVRRREKNRKALALNLMFRN